MLLRKRWHFLYTFTIIKKRESIMKKSIISLATALVASILLASCASIPEPSEKNKSMLYGKTDVLVMYPTESQKAGIITQHKKNGIYLRVKHLKSGQIYTITSNKNGEFIKTNLPEGYYEFHKISAKYNRNQSVNSFWYNFSYNDPNIRFVIKDGVTNIGFITMKINYTSEIDNGINWAYSFNQAKDFFFDEHIDSDWTDETWTTMFGDIQD